MARQTIITLTSDFGEREGYVGSMKGVILSALPGATLVDVTHQVPMGDVLAGAFVLRQIVDYYPPGTVHLAVVDPGVGTDRRVLAARYAGQTFVCPDNGLLTLVDQWLTLEAMVSVRNERYFLPRRVGRTFEGRDVMAPAAAALAGGVAIGQLGPPPDRYELLELPAPTWDGETLAGQVLYVDGFGNCITNISRGEIERTLPRWAAIRVQTGPRPLGPLRGTYAEVEPGEPLALLDSLDRLELAVRGDSASDRLGLGVGTPVAIRYGPAI